jgi:hypothetical protein
MPYALSTSTIAKLYAPSAVSPVISGPISRSKFEQIA